MNRLDTIVTRERRLAMRDLAFAAFLVLVIALTVTSLGVAFDSAPVAASR